MTDASKRPFWVEKVQVQVTAAVMLAAVFFLAPGLARPADPLAPTTFLVSGNTGGLLAFGATVIGLGAVCGLLSIATRPASAIVVALVAALAISLRSPGMDPLLRAAGEGLADAYWAMAAEGLLLGVVVLLAGTVAAITHRLTARLMPDWAWTDPLLKEDVLSRLDAELPAGTDRSLVPMWMHPEHFWMVVPHAAKSPKSLPTAREVLKHAGATALLGLAVGNALVLLLLRSADRGQVIFALMAAWMLAALLAHWVGRVRTVALFVAMPIVSAVVMNVIIAVKAPQAGMNAWMDVPGCAKGLPIDWVTAGGAGAAIGYWWSCRLAEARHTRKLEEQQEKQP